MAEKVFPAQVQVEESMYTSNHGAAPRGRGYWAFSTVHPMHADYLDHCIWVSGFYAQASREARRQAAGRGLAVLYVCP